MASFTTNICDRCKAQFDMRAHPPGMANPYPVRSARVEIDRGAGRGHYTTAIDLCEPCQDVLWDRVQRFKENK